MTNTPQAPEPKRTLPSPDWRRRGAGAFVVLFAALAFLAGCHRDPNVAKQKYLESGNRYSAEGKWREALIQYANALKIDKNYPQAHYALAKTYLHMGQYGAAYAEFERTVELQPANEEARIAVANLLLAGGRIDDAQAQANTVKAAAPNDPDLHALLSGIAFRRGDRTTALEEMRRAIQLAPNRAEFHDSLALLLASDPATTAEAEAEFQKAIALDPKSTSARILLMAFYVKNNRLPDAEKAGWSAVAADPKDVTIRLDLAKVVLRMGDTARAEQILRQSSRDLASDPQGVRLLADYYTASGQYDKAKAEFARLVGLYPKNESLQKAYIRALIQANDLATARTAVAALMKKHSQDPEVDALNGIVLIDAGKAGEAVNALQLAVKDSPQDPFLQYWLGRAALANGDPDMAKSSFLEAQRLNPSMLAVEASLASVALQQGDTNLLSDVAEKTIAAVPRFAGGYVWRAIVEMRKNDIAKAESDLDTARSIAPRDASVYLQFAKLRFAQKRFPDGVALLEQALQYNPDSVEALRLLVDYDLYNKQPQKALDRVNQQIAARPQNSGFYDVLAILQIQSKNLDQAVATAQKAIQLNPADNEAVMLYSQVEMMRGQAANAIAVWQKWSSAHPSDAGALALLGTLEETTGNKVQAESYYRKSLEYQPHQPLAANNLAYLMLENGENTDVALSLAEIARQALPDSPSTADTLAWAYYYKGTYVFARDLLEEAVKAQPGDATMQYHLGMVYSKLKDKANAEMHLKKVISLAPNSPTARQAQAALTALG